MDMIQVDSTKQLNELSLNRKLLQFLLVSCIAPSKVSMMPLAPTSTELPAAHKPKIGFSIDSIVGGERLGESKDGNLSTILVNKPHNNRSQSATSLEHSQASGSPSPEPSFTNISEKSGTALMRECDNTFARFQRHLHHHHHQFLNNNSNGISNGSSSPPLRPIPISSHQIYHHLLHHHLPLGSNSSSGNSSSGMTSPPNNHNPNNISISSSKQIPPINKGSDPASPPVSTSNNPSRSPSPQPSDSRKSPQSSSSEAVSGIPPSPHNAVPALHTGMPGAPLPPAPAGPHGMPQFAGYPPGFLNFAAVAAAAAAQAHHHPGHHPSMQGWMHPPHPGAPHHPHPAAAHPLYPWLLAKHSRLFPHRFGPGPDLPGFLLQPFRKPKRIRTAFSPSQLLKLEHAFERNHYVVGAERKQLANSLSLSETQVKVWFQNRRTKHKRMQQEEESVKKTCGGSGGANGSGSSGSNLSSSAISADSSTRNYVEEMSDDEEIIMDEDYTDEEAEMEHLRRLNVNQ